MCGNGAVRVRWHHAGTGPNRTPASPMLLGTMAGTCCWFCSPYLWTGACWATSCVWKCLQCAAAAAQLCMSGDAPRRPSSQLLLLLLLLLQSPVAVVVTSCGCGQHNPALRMVKQPPLRRACLRRNSVQGVCSTARTACTTRTSALTFRLPTCRRGGLPLSSTGPAC